LEKILLAFERDAALPGFDHTASDAETAIGQSAFVIDLDSATETAAGGTGALGIIEGEKRGRGLTEGGAVVGTDPGTGEAEFVFRIGTGDGIEDLHLTLAVAER